MLSDQGCAQRAEPLGPVHRRTDQRCCKAQHVQAGQGLVQIVGKPLQKVLPMMQRLCCQVQPKNPEPVLHALLSLGQHWKHCSPVAERPLADKQWPTTHMVHSEFGKPWPERWPAGAQHASPC